MNISLIAALSKNFIIGDKNQIPWHIPEDLKWFKKNTIHKIIIMGRLTWQSITHPLPHRINIVISHKKINQKGVVWANSINNAIICAMQYNQDIMVIGGSQIYNQMLFFANKLYLTHLDLYINGDTYFPRYQLYKSWKTIFSKNIIKSHQNPYNINFRILSR